MQEEKCDHICTSNCRRVGCNCECGEYHAPNGSKSFWGKSLAQHFLKNKQKTNMKYKLKRPLPWAEAGTIWDKRYDPYPNKHFMQIIDKDGFLGATTHTFPEATFSDWFEEVDERWKPTPNQPIYYFLTVGFESHQTADSGTPADKHMIEAGNCFRTKALVRMAAEQIKALLKEFHKNNP